MVSLIQLILVNEFWLQNITQYAKIIIVSVSPLIGTKTMWYNLNKSVNAQNTNL
jgi:hypothetical protein